MNGAKKIVKELSIPHMMDALNVSQSSILEARRKNIFPACWYRVLKAECKTKDISLSMDEFNFKPVQGHRE